MWYSQGTISATSNNTVINGTGTAFIQGVRVGDGITIAGSTSLHEVISIASNTQMTIKPAYTGATGSGKQYAVAPILGYDKDLSDAFNQLRLQFGDKLSGLQPWAHAATASAARAELGLGTAATRDVGESSGNVMEVGAFGLGRAIASQETDFNAVDYPAGLSRLAPASGVSANAPPAGGGSPNVLNSLSGGYGFQLGGRLVGFTPQFRSVENGVWGTWRELYHTGNTTKNPDGTLKASSPVINLYADRHDLHNESQFGAIPTVTRKSKGVYEITGTLGLRSEGWYLDTPNDRNGNKYFNVEWTQNITPTAVDGIVDEYRDDIVVTIETFERVWNKETGIFENGTPIDINELQDRFVQLRFNEIKLEHEELADETTTRDQE